MNFALTVNSYNHQGIRRIAENLKHMSNSKDSLIEAACMPDMRFVIAVKWHPELMFKNDTDEMKLLSAFVSACG